jgi:hypothetical protein
MFIKTFAISSDHASFSVVNFIGHRATGGTEQTGIVELVVNTEHHAANIIIKGCPFPHRMECSLPQKRLHDHVLDGTRIKKILPFRFRGQRARKDLFAFSKAVVLKNIAVFVRISIGKR